MIFINKALPIVAVGIVALAGGFFGGMKYQQTKTPAAAGYRIRQFQGRMEQNFRPVNGDIISQDDKSITVKLNDGSSKIVLLSDKTSINEATQAAKTDLQVGKKVAVFGSENSDGSVTAQSIQLNPTVRMFGQGQGG